MRISSVHVTVEFDLNQQAPLVCGSTFVSLKDELRGHLVQPSVPSTAPPDVPRMLLQTQEFNLGLGWSRIFLTATVPSHIDQDWTQVSEFVLNRAEKLIPMLLNHGLRYRWCGIVSSVDIKMGDGPIDFERAVSPISDKVINFPRQNRTLANFGFQFGVHEGAVFKGWNVSFYESKNFVVANQGPTASIDLNSMPVNESGILVQIDTNNRRNNGSEEVNQNMRQLMSAQEAAWAEFANLRLFENERCDQY